MVSSIDTLYTGTVTVPIKGREDKVRIASDLISEMVASQLKVDPTHEYTKEQLSKITSMNLNKNERFIESDLEDIAKLENLKNLQLENLKLQELTPLENLKKLETLSIRGNKIESLSPLSHSPKLKEITATKNAISDINGLKELGNLEKLWLGQSNLTSVDALKNLSNLKSLSLEYNQIKDIDALGNLQNLTELYLYNNQISDLSSISNKSVIKDARNQTITLEKQKIINSQLSIPNIIQLNTLDGLGKFEAIPSNNGEYKPLENIFNWSDLNEAKLPKSLSYQFSFGEGKIYSGKVIVPVGLEVTELQAPTVNSVLSTDKTISGKAEPKAIVKAKVEGKELTKGEAKADGTFELTMEPQKAGTKISVTQTIENQESPATEVTVEAAKNKTYNHYKLGYWRSYGFILEGQAGIEGQNFPQKGDVAKTVELVNTKTDSVEATAKATNTNWYNPASYDGYQAILTNEMIEKLAEGNYRLQVTMTPKNGSPVTEKLTTAQSFVYDFIGEYHDTISDLGNHSVNEKVVSFTEGFDQVLLNIAQGKDQVNVLNSRVNAKGDSVADLWIASSDYDYQNAHTKYLVIKDAEGKEVYNKKAPTWNIKKTFNKQVKAEWEKSGVQEIIPKAYKGKDFTKSIQVKDKEEVIQLTTEIPQEYLK